MEKNQEIRKKVTSHDIEIKDVNTSFLMFPLRLETKFINNKVIKKIHEPERIYYAFKLVWNLIYGILQRASDIKNRIKALHCIIDELDILYKEDKNILYDILVRVKNILPKEADVRDDWDGLCAKVLRIRVINTLSYNKTTSFLDELEHHTNRLRVVWTHPPYNGKRRQSNSSVYSQSARYKAGYKHLKACLEFYNSIPDRISKLSSANKFQENRYKKLIDEWSKIIKTDTQGYSPIYHKFMADDEEGEVLHSVREGERLFNKIVDDISDRVRSQSDLRRKLSEKTVNKGNTIRYTVPLGCILRSIITNDFGKFKNVISLLKRTDIVYRDHANFLYILLKFIQNNYSKDEVTQNLSGSVIVDFDTRRRGILKKMVKKASKKCLCVRIYPDEVAITQMLKKLSKTEYLMGRDFWMRYIFATESSVRNSLWLAMCDSFPAYRAAWIIRATFPKEHFVVLNKRAEDFRLEGRSFEEFDAEVEANILNVFPMTCVDTSDRVFTVPATELLPERFVVHAELQVTQSRKINISRYGHKLPHSLQLGLDLNDLENAIDDNTKQKDEYLELKGNLRWMTDYDLAEKMGMAITLPLDEFKYQRSTKKQAGSGRPKENRVFCFNSLYVVGVNEEKEDECEKIITNLLEAHLYSSDGYDLIKNGTPTNILSDGDDGENTSFDTSDEALVEKFKYQPINCVSPAPIEEREDIYLLEKLLGLKNTVLGNLKNPDKVYMDDIYKGKVVNSILIEIMARDNGLIKIFSENPVLNDFLKNDVLSRGAYPPIRIGSQPYGILPICDFRNLKMNSNEKEICAIKSLLLMLTEKWNEVADGLTQYNGDNNSTDDFLRIAGSTPVTSSYQQVLYARQKGDDFLFNPSYFKYGEALYDKGQSFILAVLSILRSKINYNIKKEDITNILESYDKVPVVDDFADDTNVTNNVSSVYKVDYENNDVLKDLIEKVRTGIEKKNINIEIKKDEEIAKLIIEFFDLFSHRLDAWMMGLLNHKLRERIKNRTHKVAIGAFGWVFNLKETVANKKNNDEYVLAPSINHAITGAVMRSAYRNSTDNSNKLYNLDVQLTSRRVRDAIRIIEGVQNGLAIGTILGTDIERLMHEDSQELDEGIYQLRKKYPMVKSDTSGEITDNDITVINGMQLLSEFNKNNETIDCKNIFTQDKYNQKKKALENILKKVKNEYDALTDVVLSDAVYKLTQGQRDAVDALIQALNLEKNIPMPEVTEIPITSAQVDGHTVIALNPKAETKESALIARVEPKIEDWLQRTIGGTENIYITIEGNEVSIKDLGISASELVYLSANKSLFLKYASLKDNTQRDPYEELRVVEDENKRSYDSMELTLDNLRELLCYAHPLKNNDFVKETGMEDEAVYDTLQNMYDKTYETIYTLHQNMVKMLSLPEVQTLMNSEEKNAVSDRIVKEAVDLMLECFSIGRTNAIDSIDEKLYTKGKTKLDDPEAYYESVEAQDLFFRSMGKMCSDIDSDLAKAYESVEEAEEKTFEVYSSNIKKLLVNNMMLVPSFVPDEHVPLDLLKQQVQGGYFSNIRVDALNDYIKDLSRVSEQMMRLHQIRMFQLFNFIDTQNMVPMQVTSGQEIDNKMWMGTFVSFEDKICDAFIYVMLSPENLRLDSEEKVQIAGVVLDHWIERIPYTNQTAGLSFNYDQPDAESPQTLLMAVASRNTGHHWSYNMLLRTIRSTMHLVKSRAVEPDDLKTHPWTCAVFPLINYGKINTNAKSSR